MDKCQSFALSQWLSDYPDDMTYEQVLAEIMGDRNGVELWEVAEGFTPGGVVDLIKDTEASARYWFDEPKQITLTWDTTDVQSVRPDLTESKAWDLLQFIQNEYTKRTGLNSKRLKAYADFFYPEGA